MSFHLLTYSHRLWESRQKVTKPLGSEAHLAVMKLRYRTFLFLFALVAFLCSCGGAQPPSSTSSQAAQILYTINGGSITTYAVDPGMGTISPLSSPMLISSFQSLVQFITSPKDNFLYVLWSDVTGYEHLSVYVTDSSGVPSAPAVQDATVQSLYQLTLHPSGLFAYAMEVNGNAGISSASSGTQYKANIRLLLLEGQTGNFREQPAPLASYGPSYVWPASLSGLSRNGNKLYVNYHGIAGAAYRERSVNEKTGALGPETAFYGDTGSWSQSNTVVIGTNSIIDIYRDPSSSAVGYLNVLTNPPTSSSIIHCTATMLSICESASNVQLDPSGKYLFLTNASTLQVEIAKINIPRHIIELTGSAIPPTTQGPGFFFSPDGALVYAFLASDGNLHVFTFNSSTGQLADTGVSLTPPAGNAAFCPAKRS
jgi:hypothetical protein